MTDVIEKEQYEFRVIAENIKGPSQPSELSEKVTIPAAVVETEPPRPVTDLVAYQRRPWKNAIHALLRECPVDLEIGQLKEDTIGSEDLDLSDVEAEMPEYEENMNKPSFLKGLTDVRCTEGEMVALRCEVNGEKYPRKYRLEWMQNTIRILFIWIKLFG